MKGMESRPPFPPPTATVQSSVFVGLIYTWLYPGAAAGDMADIYSSHVVSLYICDCLSTTTQARNQIQVRL